MSEHERIVRDQDLAQERSPMGPTHSGDASAVGAALRRHGSPLGSHANAVPGRMNGRRLRLRTLHPELVGTGGINDRAFHDHILRRGSIPVAIVGASPLNQPVDRDFRPGRQLHGG